MNNELIEWIISHLQVRRTIVGDFVVVHMNETLNDEDEEDKKIIELLKEADLYTGKECWL